MKSFKMALALITAALLALALFAAPSSGISLASASPTGDDDGANLELRPPGGTYDSGTVIEILANFQSTTAGEEVTLWRETTPGSGTYEVAEVDSAANSSGNAYFHPTVQDGARNYFAEDASARQTEVVPITGTTPVAQTGVLNAPTNAGKTWTSQFTPAVPGKAVQLQLQRIYTDEVGDVDAVNPGAKKAERVGPWKTIASGTQSDTGSTTFNLSSPYPYRVEHRYRAVSGAAATCERPIANAPPTGDPTKDCQAFGLQQTTPKDTGLSAVYFNSNEGHAIDTRSRYYEGEFSMTADSKGLGCSAVPKMKFSVMKGRGNYSWSFKRKSYTLKLGNSTDLCGMGASKKYALVSQDYDKSFLRNALAQYVGKKFDNMVWTPDSKPVDLYLNGKYLGNYLLVERIAIAADRVNVPELNGNDSTEQVKPGITGGYVLEWDFRKGADYNPYLGSDSGYVGVKEPENDYDREGVKTSKGISQAQKDYISSYLNKVDSNLRGSGFTNDSTGWKRYIDEASAVDYYIAMEYMKPVDGNMWASVYMYKQRDSAEGVEDGKLFFGPMWDFDLAAGSATRAGNVASTSSWYLKNNLGVSAQQSSKTWFHRLNEDPDFRNAVRARWNEVEGSLAPSVFLNEQKNAIQTSANTSFSSAPNGASHSYRISSYQVIKGSSWISDFDHLKWWASSRKTWMNTQF